MMSAPAMPSMMERWVLLTMAQRSPSSPVTSQLSQRGRDGSRCSHMMVPTRSRRVYSLPGLCSLARLTWSSIRNLG